MYNESLVIRSKLYCGVNRTITVGTNAIKWCDHGLFSAGKPCLSLNTSYYINSTGTHIETLIPASQISNVDQISSHSQL